MSLQATVPLDSKAPIEPCFGCGLGNARDVCALTTTLLTIQHLDGPLDNEFIPSSSETQQAAKRVISDGEAKLTTIGETIRQLQDHMKDVTQTIHRHRRFVVAIFSLPNEVLLVVFEHLASMSDIGPWTASAVCKRWRGVALANSALWTRISYGEVHGDAPDRPARLKKRLAIQMPRAGDHSNLHLSFDTSNAFNGLGFEANPTSLLFAHAERFSSADFYSSKPSEWTYQRAPSFSSLKTVNINHKSWVVSGDLCRWAPLVTALTIRDIALDTSINLHNLNFRQLRRLIITSCSLSHLTLLQLLQLIGKDLDEFELDYDCAQFYHPLPPDASGIVDLPRLRRLSIASSRIRYSTTTVGRLSFLAHLRAPKLHHLHLMRLSEEELLAVQGFIQRSDNAHLKELSFEDLYTSDHATLIAIFSKLPSIETLSLRSLHRCEVVEQVINALHWPASSTSSSPPASAGLDPAPNAAQPQQLFPHLRTVRLGLLRLSVMRMRSLIRSRSAATKGKGSKGSGAHRGAYVSQVYLAGAHMLQGMQSASFVGKRGKEGCIRG